MKVGFASRFSPLDKRSWSGTTYYSHEQIKKYYETEIFQFKWTWRVREWLTMQKSMNRKFFKTQTAVEFLRSYSKYFSRQLEKELVKRPVDLLFVSASSQMIAYLETDIPIIYMTDATFQQLQGYYAGFSNLPAYNIRQGMELDKKAFQRASHSMLASEWNRSSAINDYGIEPGKISVHPCGANLDNIPSADSISPTASKTLRLLFLGVEWERKGGEIVLDSFRILQKHGLKVQLNIIGCVPPHDLSNDSNIKVIPFLDKNKDEDLRELDKIFRETDLLFLPTRAECAGVVFSEASAFAIPSITTDTGGVSTYVLNGVNGFALPFTAQADQYAQKIIEIYTDEMQLQELRKSSRTYYDEKLSWDNWGLAFKRIAERLISQPHGRMH
jgi:glycosyltransferase involved in cell wall biosynthesis